jgi:phospholipase A1/A2
MFWFPTSSPVNKDHMKIFVFLLFFFSSSLFAEKLDLDKTITPFFGNIAANKFSFHEPTYFIGGKDDLKLQFSGKYRFARNLDFYFGYTQTMFWSIYTTSQPFTDINFNPEFFYRLIDKEFKFLKSLDIGFIHSSNGKDSIVSRSINRLYLKGNMATALGRHLLIADVMAYNIVSTEATNRDIRDHLGYWEATIGFTHLITHEKDHLDLEFRVFAGEKVFDFNRGGRSIGLIYSIESDNFNPEIYLQYYSGYAENLLNYNKQTDQLRVGLLLTI